MIAEIGFFSLLIASYFAVLLVTMPTLGIVRRNAILQQSADTYVYGQFFFVALAYGCLTIAFLTNDFSVTYVLSNSSLDLPWFYKLCAVWGGHEGSMLLWVLILSFWMVLVSLFSKNLAPDLRVRVSVVLGVVSVGLLFFLITTSNPFIRQFEVLNSQGRDLNPLLQDPGFLFHPPMLYMGYVGFSVAFAFAIASLWLGRIEPSWAKWTRPWTLAAWCCLTAGITLGSWWAYRELGWGGWWFWDPVENASFMPWLVGTALIHSLAVNEKRQQFKGWTLLLAIAAFSLSLIGTFLVRSGVLTSVHAFAVDPQRGLYILCFLMVVIGGSLLLFAFRAQSIQSQNKPAFVSRDSALLLNNVFFTAAMLTVLLGTTYPLLIDSLGLGKLSVGAPYFDAVFVPLMIPVFVLMGIGIHLKWQRDDLRVCLRNLRGVFLMSLLLPLLFLLFLAKKINWSVALGLVFAFWILLSSGQALVKRLKSQNNSTFSQAFLGMLVAHCGVAVTIIGIVVSSGYGLSDDMRMQPGDTVSFAGYSIAFMKETELVGPNYHGTQAHVTVANKKGTYTTIYPEKRIYNVGKMAMTDSAIDVTPFRDIYVALGEPLENNAWSVRLYYKPFVRWIWAGGFFILAGGVLAMSDRRYYKKKTGTTAEATG